MKKIVMLLSFVIVLIAQNAEAQTKKKPSSKKTTSSKSKSSSTREKEATKEATKEVSTDGNKMGKEFWTEKMMYGSYLNYPTLGNGFFNMALSPMIGYKINENIAAGVLTKFSYTWVKSGIATQPPRQFVDLGVGLFARAKILQRFVLHAEYESTKYSGLDQNSQIIKVRETSANAGVGYMSGFGKWKSEFGLYYDLLHNQKVTNANKNGGYLPVKSNPFDIRIALTYNF
jgi:hypothetical protein